MLWNETIRLSILGRLSGYRYTHTLGCERAAKMLATQYGADPEQCAMAACLHDITKLLSRQEQLNLCDKYDIIPCDVEKEEWKMLHGKTAAAIALHEYGVSTEMADAIAYHTTGRANMTLLDKILYMADYMEETRDFPGVETVRAVVKKDLDQALLFCFDHSLNELIERQKLLHGDTIAARNDLIAKGVRYELP